MKFYLFVSLLISLSLILSPWIIFGLMVLTIIVSSKSPWWLFAFGVWLDILFANNIAFFQVELPIFTVLTSMLIPVTQALYKRINLSISL